ncbi:MAG: hypothetical protein ACRC3H_17245 [Lachnospiraceae bacterium]
MVNEDEVSPKGRGDPLDDKNKNKKKKWAGRIAALIVILLLLLLVLYRCGYDGREPNTDYIIGAGVKQGAMDNNDDAPEESSNGTSSMRVKLNGYPVFPDGKSSGNLRIENPAENSLNMNVEIKLNDTEEVIYESGAIPPNHYIDEDKLSVILEKGEYNATAYVTLYNPENEDVMYNSSKFALVIQIIN